MPVPLSLFRPPADKQAPIYHVRETGFQSTLYFLLSALPLNPYSAFSFLFRLACFALPIPHLASRITNLLSTLCITP
jgi:hypothetical protein